MSNAAQMVASITTVNTTKTTAKSIWLDFMCLILARRDRLELVGPDVSSIRENSVENGTDRLIDVHSDSASC